MIKKFFLILAICSSFSLFAKDDHHVEDQPKVIEQTLTLDHFGVLKQKPNGYLYLDVPNEYISELLPLIEAPGRIAPPQHYTSKKGIGAHISVMYENEQIDNEIWEIGELGETYSFTIKELRTVKINRNNKTKKLWLIALDSPQLESLRKDYGLPNRIKGHDFHITLGYQLPAAQNLSEAVEIDCADLDEEVYVEAA
ncbi:MAG: hypothetical protein KR126chlam2_00277 [Chlamydiae bacterium]|nr:hypothetical protein [Chlamydiota bacterium]